MNALVTFVDPATGALRVATGSSDRTVRVWDAETGDALLVIDVGFSEVLDAGVLCGSGDRRAAACLWDGQSALGNVCAFFDPVAGGEALLVIVLGSWVNKLALFTDPATGAPRLARGYGQLARKKIGDLRIYDPVTGGEALVVIDVGSEVRALAVFKDPATGAPRLACGARGDGKVRASTRSGRRGIGRARGTHGIGGALTVFEDLATGGLRLASGSIDNKVRVWDLTAGGALLFVLAGHTNTV